MSTFTGLLPVAIEAPTFVPSAYGLLSTARVSDDGTLRWASGATFQSNAGGSLDGMIVEDGCDPWVDKAPNLPETWADALAIVLYGWWHCSPAGFTLEEAAARMHEKFLAAEGRGLEALLWEWFLTHTTAAGGTVTATLGKAEQAIATVYGGEGLIHVNRATATAFANAGLIARYGTGLRTIGAYTPVVVGDGYQDDGALAVVATGPMSVVRGPLTDMGDGKAQFTRPTNDLNAMAERAYQITVEAPVLAFTAT